MIKKFILLFIVVCIGLPLAASPLSGGEWPVMDLEKRSGFFFKADPRLGIEEVSGEAYSSRFTSVANRTIWVGNDAPAAWLRFAFTAAELAEAQSGGNAQALTAQVPAAQWLLVVRPSFSIILDHVSLYVPRAEGGFDEIKTGAKEARLPGEPYSRYFVFELPSGAFSGAPCYLRLASSTDVSVTFDLETSQGLAARQRIDTILYGLVYGIIVAMILYSFFLLLSLKDFTYLYYIFYILSAGLWLFFVQGHAKWLFGQHPRFDQAMLWFWAGSMLVWGAGFTSSFLRLKEGRPVLYHIILVLIGLGFVVCLAGLAGWDDIAFSLSHYLGLILPVMVIIAAVARLIQGFPSALYFLIAWSFLAVGGFIFSLMGFKILPVNFLTVNAMAIGMTAESILLSMALADRFKLLETEKKTLEKIQDHYRELSLTDDLTGLHNKRFLQNELDLAMARSKKIEAPLSLILLDIDDFKNVNDSFGHSVGDEMLVTLARSMRNNTRESDSSCRIGGDELVIIMPGVEGEDAFRVAERIRNGFASDSARKINDFSLSVTVSLGIVTFNGKESSEALMMRADDAMYEAKRLGKNRSVIC